MKSERLICVDEKNHNKIYDMVQTSGSEWVATYGRVGSTMVKTSYNMSQWDKKYWEKIRKGYKPITHLVVENAPIKETVEVDIQDEASRALADYLKACAKKLLDNNYSVAIRSVTQKQLQEAQLKIDYLIKLRDDPYHNVNSINYNLIQLYGVIPRRMSSVKDHLLKSWDEKVFNKMINEEQDLLDTLSQQVSSNTEVNTNSLYIRKASDEEMSYVYSHTDLDSAKVAGIYVVNNKDTETSFKKLPNTRLLYHGSLSSNWWHILSKGLKIRPAGVSCVGSMFGVGLYFAHQARKSAGYTDSGYWKSGSGSGRKFLGLYEVALGKSWDVLEGGKKVHSYRMSSLNRSAVRNAGYDSVFASQGSSLKNDEFIIYDANQSTIRFLVEIK